MLVLLPLLTRWFFLFSIQMENNYSVYQHVTPDGMYYFGQTNNIKRRWECNGVRYKTTALQPYIEKFGWDNIQHIVLFKDQTRENALWIENFLIETAREDGVCINQRRSGNISKEEGYRQQRYQQNREKELERRQDYYQKNKDKQREYDRQYRQQNKEKIQERKKQYYEQNKEQILEQKKQYYEQNKDRKREYDRQRYQQNREKKLEQNRQRYKRKKLEKQLKEAAETTLF